MEKPASLRKVPIFSFLKDKDLKTVAQDVTETHYEKGQYIFKEGDPAESFHIIKSGSVKCVKSSLGGREAVLKMLLPGDLFCCEAAVFDGAKHPGCALTMSPVSLLKISKKAYFKLLKESPEASLEIIKYLGNRLNEAQETAKTFALERADQRIATLLIKLAERIGKPSPAGVLLDIRLNRQDLADMAGLALETTIRTISKMTRKKLLGKSGRSLVIRDLKALRALAESAA